jgi:hypothetical protein
VLVRRNGGHRQSLFGPRANRPFFWSLRPTSDPHPARAIELAQNWTHVWPGSWTDVLGRRNDQSEARARGGEMPDQTVGDSAARRARGQLDVPEGGPPPPRRFFPVIASPA